MNIKLIIAYFGATYVGWQKTNKGRSVEGMLEQALEKILQHPVKLQAASRTDAGVHAKGQVVNFFTQKQIPFNKLQAALNGALPKEIVVIGIEEVPESFHPTLDSLGKEYHYQLCNTQVQLPFYKETSWHFFYPLDIRQMQKAAGHLVGAHDFSAFCNKCELWDRPLVCHLEKVEVTPLDYQRMAITLRGSRFLYRMARNLAGTIAYAGCGKLDPDQIGEILKNKDRRLAGMTAPAHGLSLIRVFY